MNTFPNALASFQPSLYWLLPAPSRVSQVPKAFLIHSAIFFPSVFAPSYLTRHLFFEIALHLERYGVPTEFFAHLKEQGTALFFSFLPVSKS